MNNITVSIVEREVRLRGSDLGVRIITIPSRSLQTERPAEAFQDSDNEADSHDVEWLRSLEVRLRPITIRNKDQLAVLLSLLIDQQSTGISIDLDVLTTTIDSELMQQLRYRSSPEARALASELVNHSYVPLPKSPALRTLTMATLVMLPTASVWLGIDPVHSLVLAIVTAGATLIVAPVVGVAGGIEEGLRVGISARIADYVRRVGRESEPPIDVAASRDLDNAEDTPMRELPVSGRDKNEDPP